MFTTIVVGTDGSQTARRAVALAGDLARRFDAQLHVVNGFRDPEAQQDDEFTDVEPSSRSSIWRQASEDVLVGVRNDPMLEGVKIDTHSVVGGASDVIIAVAGRVGADLIVVGNRGMHGSEDSVPNSVAHRAPCHVLVAKTT
jgi:nucleotide-binding universal stress UspA family protein